MYTQTLTTTFLALLAFTHCAPLQKRDTCAVVGYEGDEQISTYGIAAASTAASGSLGIYCTNGKKWDSGKNLPKSSQTISSKDTGLPQDVHWKQDWQTGGYKSCSASYGSGNYEKGVVGSNNIETGFGVSGSGEDRREGSMGAEVSTVF
ncbi:MAG: hypothetical protein M1812_002667 [Candelaria pacifica]|nr:MAG: hypothetical protein M1812_002667 [Candelaria pacifica]